MSAIDKSTLQICIKLKIPMFHHLQLTNTHSVQTIKHTHYHHEKAVEINWTHHEKKTG